MNSKLCLLLSNLSIVLKNSISSSFSPPPTPPPRPDLVTKSLQNNTPIYYFAVGSNMSRTKVENRSIDGTKIHILQMEPAIVHNHRLAFNLRAFPPLEPGMGSLEPVSSQSKAISPYHKNECHGALLCLEPQEYEKVVKSEGIGRPNPGYEEIVVTVTPYDTTRPPIQAVSLRARDHVRLDTDACPSIRYMEILREGATELGIRSCYIDWLHRHPIQENSALLRKIAVHNMICVGLLAFRYKLSLLAKVQNWLIWRLYAPSSCSSSSSSVVRKKIASEVGMAMVLLPGSILGFVLLRVMNLMGGSLPPMMKSMLDRYG